MLSLIFGAGASYGSEVKGIPTPPLGDYLFEELEKLNGAYSKLPEEVKNKFRINGFEQGMLGIPNDSSVINPLQKELAIYLSKFQSTEKSSYVKLFRMLGCLLKNINIITLNYDLLIEQSLFMVGAKSVSYGLNQGEVSLLKVHGSSNFIPDLSGSTFEGVTAINCGSFIECANVKALNSHKEIFEWCSSTNNSLLSPIMCLYNQHKNGVINNSLLSAFKRQYKYAITGSKLIVIVGVKYVPHDHHIWDDILDTNARLIIVDPKPDKQLIDKLAQKKINVEIINKPFNDCVARLSGMIRTGSR
ncbi:TPA: hypothetical protein ACH7TX_000865 [Escherichia coli]